METTKIETKKTQCGYILAALMAGERLTVSDGFRRFNTNCFPRRIKDLKDGLHDGIFHDIKKINIPQTGNRARYSVWYYFGR